MYGKSRVRLVGKNGSGKSTLLKIICGELKPETGTVKTFGKIAYVNQDLSVLDKNKNIIENIMEISDCLKHDAHAIAANFGFRGNASQHRVGTLSGGELLKATLAAILGGDNQPDLLILDEPTNNLEIKSIGIFEEALNQYRGAILLVTHMTAFVKEHCKTLYISFIHLTPLLNDNKSNIVSVLDSCKRIIQMPLSFWLVNYMPVGYIIF